MGGGVGGIKLGNLKRDIVVDIIYIYIILEVYCKLRGPR